MDITLLSAASDEFLSGLPDDTALALGLSWAPLTAGVQAANAISVALGNKATHLVHADGKSSVGLAKLKRAEQKQLAKQKISRVLSAASLLATLKPIGTSLVTLPIESVSSAGEQAGGHENAADERVWLGAVSNGAVLRGHDVVVTRAQADEIWRALQERYKDKATRFDHGNGFDWQDLVELGADRQAEAVVNASRLVPAKAGSLVALKRIPKPMKYAAGVLVIAGVAQYLLIPIMNQQIARYRKAHEPVVDPAALWQESYEQWAGARKLAGVKSVEQVTLALRNVPVHIARWDLTRAVCDLDAMRGGWKCAAQYVWPVEGVGPSASTNAAFQASIPKDWALEWKPLGGVTARFQVAGVSKRFNEKELETKDWHLVNSVSYLQRLERVLELGSKPLGEFARVPVATPKLPNGTNAPVPANLKFPLVATLQVDGPLRSMTEKLIHMPQVSWKQVAITVTKNVTPDRAKSELKANLQGEIYAKP
ncbi:hypothetical protein [Variovorax gossypii]